MNYRLIAVDLDDTLLGNDLKISPANKRALFAAREMGVQVTIATGRMLDSAMPYITELDIEIPVITYQGAFLKDIHTGKTLIRKSVSMEHALSIIEDCKGDHLHLQVYTEDSYYFEEENQYSRLYHRLTGIQGEAVGDLARFLEEEPIKLLIVDEPPRIQEVLTYFKNKFGDNLQISTSKPNYLEFTHREATKGNALALLGNMMQIPREKIIAIGDSFNDITMLDYAGLGVAMGNAPDPVKAHADYITSDSDMDGVADLIDRFLLRKE